jgi:predicted phage terminase large subunit-like protein
MFFRREWFPIADAIPSGWKTVIRYWDRAATRPSAENPDPDYTAGLKLYTYSNGTHIIGDVRRIRDTPGQVEQMIRNTASFDGNGVRIFGEQEPGASGVSDAQNFVKLLAGYDVHVRKPSTDKLTRAKPVSAQCEAGNIRVLRAPWNDAFFTELENFDGTEISHDDQVDTLSGAYNESISGASMFDVY